jgi:hypothetical protein
MVPFTNPSCSAKAEHPRLASGQKARRGWHAFACHDGLNNGVVQVIPVRIAPFDQAYLPGPGPAFQCLLARNGLQDGLVRLGMNETVQPITMREIRTEALAMLPDPARKIGGHADIQDAVGPIGDDIDSAAFHNFNVMNNAKRRYLYRHARRRPSIHALLEGRVTKTAAQETPLT